MKSIKSKKILSLFISALCAIEASSLPKMFAMDSPEPRGGSHKRTKSGEFKISAEEQERLNEELIDLIGERNCSIEEVKKLVNQGADVNATNNDGLTVLRIAAYRGHLEVVKYLVDYGAADAYRVILGKCKDALEIISNSKAREIIVNRCQALSDEIERVSQMSYEEINTVNENGETPLIKAIKNNNINAVSILIRKGAQLYVNGKNVMNYAKNNEIKKLLMIALKRLSRYGNTALN